MSRWRRRRSSIVNAAPAFRAALGAVSALLLTSCTGLGTASPPVPAEPQVVSVAMRDNSYKFGQETFAPGRLVFQAHNHDDRDHDLALVELPDDVSGVEEWLEGGVGGVHPIYTMADRAPGEEGTFAVDLSPGHYGMLCLVENDDGTPHYQEGMVASFRVRKGVSP